MQPTQVQIDLVRVERLATSRKYMHAQVVGRTIMIDIATNPDLDDPRENSAKGVAPDSWEAATAAAAVCRRAQIELMKRGLDFYDFLNREIDRRGGRGKVKGRKHNGIAVLAAEVLGLPLSQDRFLPKQGWTERQLKNFRAERRKIEEHTQIDKDTGKPKYVFFKTKRSASYAGLKGAEAGNPFLTPAERWSYELDKATIRGRILGDWKISQRIYKNSPRRTDPETPDDEPFMHGAIRSVLTDNPLSLIDAIVIAINDFVGQYGESLTHLLHCFAISLEIRLS